jgi:hypothetical protein
MGFYYYAHDVAISTSYLELDGCFYTDWDDFYDSILTGAKGRCVFLKDEKGNRIPEVEFETLADYRAHLLVEHSCDCIPIDELTGGASGSR